MPRGNCTWPNFELERAVPCGYRNDTITQIPCCVPGDTCLSNNICKYTQSKPGGSGYYASGCTDGKFGHRACSRRCQKQRFPDIVYTDNNIWKCCGIKDGVRQCEDPSDASFEAPPPDQLLQYWFAGQSKPPGPTSTSEPTSASEPASTATSSSLPNPDSGDEAGLSTGAKAGIGVGSTFAGLLVLAAVALFIWRRRRRRIARDGAMPPQSAPDMTKEPVAAGDRTPNYNYPVEAPATSPDNRRNSQGPAELPSEV